MIIKKTCIMCPLGCTLIIDKVGNEVKSVAGNNCIRGEEYARQETIKPMRVLTTLISAPKGVVPVKTTGPIPKTKLAEALRELDKIKLDHNPKFHETIITNFLGTGVDVVVTRK